ncbi:hypothetical protein C8J57DRAFT_1668324 [Mycena rebaudengoi]|nr:hypothetical protein C8J57DRAFT_1668324 [Mycena rebaudengoi]
MDLGVVDDAIYDDAPLRTIRPAAHDPPLRMIHVFRAGNSAVGGMRVLRSCTIFGVVVEALAGAAEWAGPRARLCGEPVRLARGHAEALGARVQDAERGGGDAGVEQLVCAGGELSTLSRAPRTIYLSDSHQFAFRPLGVIREYKLGIGGANIAVRKEVEISSSAGAAGGYASSRPRTRSPSSSFDEPLACAPILVQLNEVNQATRALAAEDRVDRHILQARKKQQIFLNYGVNVIQSLEVRKLDTVANKDIWCVLQNPMALANSLDRVAKGTLTVKFTWRAAHRCNVAAKAVNDQAGLGSDQASGPVLRWGNQGGCSSRPAALVRARNNGIYERKLFIGSKLKFTAIQNNILRRNHQLLKRSRLLKK